MFKAARALAGWKQSDLAAKSGVSVESIKRIEKTPGPIEGRDDTYAAVLHAFATKRIEFLFEGGHGVLRRNGPRKSNS
ncbi:MAG: helix-turn-helix transcriptional regulator [Pseudolabrys sp.]|nr:helix-turn-helix transcriptional regulator [Pseudolabrys sp.]